VQLIQHVIRNGDGLASGVEIQQVLNIGKISEKEQALSAKADNGTRSNGRPSRIAA
jgi:hypothetical protein